MSAPQAAAPPALEARGVGKTYRLGTHDLEVLGSLDLRVEAGEWVLVVGTSGAGKSTLLRILGTLEEPSAAPVSVTGRVVTGQSEAALAPLRREMLGFVFQFHHLLGEFTALENVMIPALLAGVSVPEARRRALELLGQVDLGLREEHRPGELSGGEQQRVAVARALVNRPEVILADEPTGNLDPEHGAEVEGLMTRLARDRNAALVVATHDPGIFRNAKRVLRLEGGLVRDAQSP